MHIEQHTKNSRRSMNTVRLLVVQKGRDAHLWRFEIAKNSGDEGRERAEQNRALPCALPQAVGY